MTEGRNRGREGKKEGSYNQFVDESSSVNVYRPLRIHHFRVV